MHVVDLICRVAAAIAVVYFWAGAALNAPITRRAKFTGPDEECYLLKGGVFVRAAMLNLIATLLGIMSCVLLRLPAATDTSSEQSNHTVGLPQWPAQGYGQEAYPHPAQGYGQASDLKFAPPPPV